MRTPILLILVLLGGLFFGYQKTTEHWAIGSATFVKSDKPYGGGAFRIKGDDVMTIKVAGPELKFKPSSEQKTADVAEFTEAWMDDPREVLNRETVSFLRGEVDGTLIRRFQTPGQNAAWWYSSDWATHYLATERIDYEDVDPKTGRASRATKLWHSTDGGNTWTPLAWPENQSIKRLMFLDATRGYAIGEGPCVWRTADGGRSWREMALPRYADNSGHEQNFNGTDLSATGVLRMAFYVDGADEVRASTFVFRLNWDAEQFEHEVTLKQQAIVALRSAPNDSGVERIYALSALGSLRDLVNNPRDDARRTGAISTWTAAQPSEVQQLHTFDSRFSFNGLSVGKRGVVLVYATDASRNGAPHNFTFSSTDSGKSWEQQDDGISQGGYFDPDTNTLYRLYGYTLKKQTF